MNVYIVWGPPAAGKTTYVREHKMSGDLIVDFDLIKQAVSMEPKTGNIGDLYPLAEGVREYLYQKIETRDVAAENAWVIGSLANSGERQALAHRLAAKLIFIDTSYGECVRRAMKDAERKDKELQLFIIDKWFSNYQKDSFFVEERWD